MILDSLSSEKKKKIPNRHSTADVYQLIFFHPLSPPFPPFFSPIGLHFSSIIIFSLIIIIIIIISSVIKIRQKPSGSLYREITICETSKYGCYGIKRLLEIVRHLIAMLCRVDCLLTLFSLLFYFYLTLYFMNRINNSLCFTHTFHAQ